MLAIYLMKMAGGGGWGGGGLKSWQNVLNDFQLTQKFFFKWFQL